MDLATLHLHWRESRYKDSKYRSYCLARAYREDGKNRREIVLKLGKLTDAEANRWKSLIDGIKNQNAVVTDPNDIAVTENLDFLDVALAIKIWDEWEFDNFFPARGRKSISTADIAKVLVANRCIDPLSKHSVANWFAKTHLPTTLNIDPKQFNPSRIYRELECIEDSKELICSHIFSKIRRERPDTLDSTFYDLSTSIFHGSKCILVEWGRAKEGYRDHIVLAMAVTNEGLPFYWKVLKGGTSDISAFKELLTDIGEKFSIDGVSLTFDRGMVSNANLKRLERDKIHYVTALDKPQIEKYSKYDFREPLSFEPDNVDRKLDRRSSFHRYSKDTFFRDSEIVGGRRYILGFNTSLFKGQRAITEKNIGIFLEFIDDLNNHLEFDAIRPNSDALYKKVFDHLTKYNMSSFIAVDIKERKVRRYCSKVEDHISVSTFRIKPKIHDDKRRDRHRLDGFWMIVSNHIETDLDDKFLMPCRRLIKTYRDKYIIEDAFRDVKSFIDISPTYLWSEKHVRAHYTLCAIAHLINRVISLKLKQGLEKQDSGVLTAAAVYSHLRTCKLNRVEIKKFTSTYQSTTKLTDLQLQILKQLELPRLAENALKTIKA